LSYSNTPGTPGTPEPRAPRARASAHRSRLKVPDWFARHGGWFALALIVLLVGFVGYVFWTLRDLPDPGSTGVLARSIVIYDRHGKQIEQRNAQGEYHDVVKLKDMGKLVPAAMLAAEDRNFYSHGAVDIPSTARAAFNDLLHRGATQGGSTITQQLIKIQLLTPQRSVFRKVQEAVLATALEQKYSKDQILDLYLNRVYYGHNAYGVGAATKTYFGKDKEPKDLTPAQAAFLAALVQAPVYYDPQTHYDRAKGRQLYVLSGLVATHTLTQAEADKAAQENIQAELKFDTSPRQSLAPHFVDYVISKLEAQFGSAAIQQGGFAVYTTLDLGLQDLAQRSVADGVGKLKGGGVNNGMLLAAKPDTGEILAWVGSADYYNNAIGGQYDVITHPRQPGSSFKPYVYEAALKDHKITLAQTVSDKPTDFGNGYKPLDFDNSFMGDMSARRALLLSRNVPAVQVGEKEGEQNYLNLAKQMGIKSDLKAVPSAAIGADEITMFDHLQGYATFANQGTKMPLMAITRIVDVSGNTVFQQDPGKQDGKTSVLTPAEAYLMTDVLKDYQNQWHMGWNRQMASKSGTTGGSQTGVHKDAWMMAYSPDIAVGAWGGNTEAGGGGQNISTFGTEVGQLMLGEFINGMPSNMKAWYQRPSGLVDGTGCPGDKTNGGHEIFLPGTEKGIDCAKPTPSPSSSPTDSTTPTPAAPLPTTVPSIVPTILPTNPPTPRPPTPTPAASP
jgi:membrane peptidoglycan carboxypeptidase